MRDANTLEVLPSYFELGVLGRDCIDPFAKQQRVGFTFGAIFIKLILQELIDGGVESERWARWTADAKSSVEIEAARAIQEEIELAAAERKG